MPLNAGQLDRRVTIQARQTTRDAAGGSVVTYTERATVWAMVRWLTGREVLAAQQVVAAEQAEFTLRHRADVLPTDRLVLDGAAWDVQHIGVMGRNEALRILAARPGDEAT